MLDNGITLKASNGVSGGKNVPHVSRRRFQTGSVKIEPRAGGPVYIGRYFCYVQTPEGEKRREKTEPLGRVEDITKTEAKRRLQPFVDRVNKQAITGYLRDDVTFGEFVQRWQDKMLDQYEKSTQQNMPSTLKPVVAHFSRYKLSQIRGEEVQGFVKQQSLDYKPKSIKNQLGAMKTVWNVARQWGYIEHDPFFKLKTPKVARGTQRYFTELEAWSIVDATPSLAEQIYWEMHWQGGVRFGELTCASRDSFRFVAQKCGDGVIREMAEFAVLRTRWNGHIRELAGKSENAIRRVALSPLLTVKIKKYIDSLPEGQKWLFQTRTGRPWPYTWVRKQLLIVCGFLGIEGGQTKAFRHGNATKMVSENVPGPVVTSRLGHYSSAFTEEVYAKPLMQDEIHLALRFDTRITKAVN